MKKYQTRTKLVEAQQFKGGVTDASHILKWINTNGGRAVWCGATAPYTNADGRVRHPGLPETLRIRTWSGWEMVDIDDYVIRNDQGLFVKCDAKTFDTRYETTLADLADITPKILDLAAINSSVMPKTH